MSLFEGRDLDCVRGARRVFSGLSFAVPEGGALLLVGPNGSGKSSLLRLMAGLLRPAAGRITWNGEPIHEDPEAHGGRTHYIGHLDAVKPVLSAAENLAFWAGLRRGGRDRIEDALDRFGLAALADTPGRMLSQGQKRRLALARLLATPAAIWLMDEPAAGLDDASLARLGEEVARHRAGGGRVVAAMHGSLPIEPAERLALDDFPAGPVGDYAW